LKSVFLENSKNYLLLFFAFLAGFLLLEDFLFLEVFLAAFLFLAIFFSRYVNDHLNNLSDSH